VVVSNTFNAMLVLRKRLAQHKADYADVLAESERLASGYAIWRLAIVSLCASEHVAFLQWD
jgi:hypothetical protein